MGMEKHALREIVRLVIQKAGGQTALARLLQPYHPNLRQQHIEKWLRYGYRIPGEYCPAIQIVTGVNVKTLRPDIFGPNPHSAPSHRTAPANPVREVTA